MKTEIIKLNNDAHDAEKIRYAAGLVESGKLVAFPTETVYGIAACAQSDVISRLDEIKSRDEAKHYSLHVSSPWDVFKFVPRMNLRSKKLVQKCLPGPLTIVFDVDQGQLSETSEWLCDDSVGILYKGGSIGVRCPANAVGREFLANISKPVVAPSANPSGMSPAVDAEGVIEMLDGQIDAVLDAGPCKEKLNSTVVRVTSKGVEILRQGGLSEEDINSALQINIDFVCTGNTCRSPMAAAFFRKSLAQKLGCDVDQLEELGYIVASAGVMAAMDQPASREAIEVCRERGIDISDHRSNGLSQKQILKSDFIFVMSDAHRERILGFYPEVKEKCRLLSEQREISDPFGGDLAVYRECASQIAEAVEERLGELSL